MFAQSPEKMSYQAVVRNTSNNLITTQAVGMQVSILQGSATGTAVYVETQNLTSNVNGLVSMEIGTGNVVSGDFTTIDWGNDSYFIKTETDPIGGTSYTISGTSQMMSVPFAMYAKTSGSSTPGPQGPIGITGAPGSAGVDGAVGPQGAQGIAGTNGTDGVDGATGPQGAVGATGAASTVAGPQGAAGPAGNYTAGAGISIATGVISATGSVAPEYLMVNPDGISGGYVTFGNASAVNGIAYNTTTNEFTLKAGKTYMLDGAVYMHSTSSGVTYSFVFRNKTNNTNIGVEAYQRATDYSGALINQPTMAGIITPTTDIQVGVKDVYGATGGFISSRGFFRIIEVK